MEQAREFSKRPEGATQRAYNSDSDSESDRETRGKEKKRVSYLLNLNEY